MSDESALKDIVHALGERIFSLEGQLAEMATAAMKLMMLMAVLVVVCRDQRSGWRLRPADGSGRLLLTSSQGQ